jgi:amidohydrolase
MFKMMLTQGVQALEETVVTLRRDLHKIPEAGFEEYKTSEYICKFLDSLNIIYTKKYAKTAIVAYFEGKKENNKTFAFRADMDALSMEELTTVEFKSQHDGFMHGCGHDGHMTMLLGFAKYLKSVEDLLEDNVVLVFQPAEEGPGGADVMIKEGLMDDYQIDEIYGIHLHPDFEEGVIAVADGPIMAMTGEFDIDIITKSGHGAMPHTAVDGMIVAANMINQFQTIISRNIDPTSAGVVTVGRIDGGERRNIIAERVRLEGTTRAFSEKDYHMIQKRIRQICTGLQDSFDCEINLEVRTMYPPVVNHKTSVDRFIKANESLKLVPFPPQMIAEDFSYYLKEREGAFVFLGVRNEQAGHVFPLHNARFNFDESVLLMGIQSYINVLKYNGNLI